MAAAEESYAFVARVPVRWSDMDAFGHINHARMVTLMEEARIQWLLSAGEAYAPLIKSAMIVHVEIRYQAQLRHDDSPLTIAMPDRFGEGVPAPLAPHRRMIHRIRPAAPGQSAAGDQTDTDPGTNFPRA